MLEIRRIVQIDARRQHVALPRRRRQLDALQLRDDLRDPVALVQLRARLHVLPAQQEADEVGRRDRFDLLAQPADGEAMDARQEATLAPVGLRA